MTPNARCGLSVGVVTILAGAGLLAGPLDNLIRQIQRPDHGIPQVREPRKAEAASTPFDSDRSYSPPPVRRREAPPLVVSGQETEMSALIKWIHSGNALLYEQRFEEAIEAYRKAHAHSSITKARILQGNALLGAGRYAAAIEAYDKADNEPDAIEGIALCNFHLGFSKKALTALDELSRSHPARAALLKGKILIRYNAIPLAVRELEKVASEPDAQEILQSLEKIGLRRFREVARSQTGPGCYVFEPTEQRGLERVISCFFAAESAWTSGYARPPIPIPMFVLSVRPAPRKKWLIFTVIEKEYSIAAQTPERTDLIRFSSTKPYTDDLVRIAHSGGDWQNQMQKGEEAYKTGSFQEAKKIFKDVGYYGWDFSVLSWLCRIAVVKEGRSATNLRDSLYALHPMWGRLEWARVLTEAKRYSEAREFYKEAIKLFPLRYEPRLNFAEMEWGEAAEAQGVYRALRIQGSQEQIQQIPVYGSKHAAFLSAQIAFHLGCYALANDAIQLASQDNVSQEVEAFRAYLKNVNQDDFYSRGTVESESNPNIKLMVWESRKGPPENDAIIHHSAEIAVVDKERRLIETFAISSQAFPPGTPRTVFLDRITVDGLETLQTYEGELPDALSVARSLASKTTQSDAARATSQPQQSWIVGAALMVVACGICFQTIFRRHES